MGVGFRAWGTWGSYYSIPEAIFYVLKGGYKFLWQSHAMSTDLDLVASELDSNSAMEYLGLRV